MSDSRRSSSKKKKTKDEHSTRKPSFSKYTIQMFIDQFPEIVIFKKARKKIIKMYTGDYVQAGLLDIVSKYIDQLVKHKSGVSFLYKLVEKTKYKNVSFINALCNYYDVLLTTPPGCRLLCLLLPDFSPSKLLLFINKVLDPSQAFSDPEMINLIIMIPQVHDLTDQYIPFLDLDLYISNENAIPIIRAIIEFANSDVVDRFYVLVYDKLPSLLVTEGLTEILISLLFRGPMKRRLDIYRQFFSSINGFYLHHFRWRIIHAMLTTLPLADKNDLAKGLVDIIRGFANTRRLMHLPYHTDPLLRLALDSVDATSRSALVHSIQCIYGCDLFPETEEYLNGLQKLSY